MKVGILTFHASHNYGSMLQVYALQRVITEMGHDCEIINFRTKRQCLRYRPFFYTKGIRSKIKALVYPTLAISDIKKHKLFESFAQRRLILTPQIYRSNEELKENAQNYDVYISGSDQIWNLTAFDFDDSYFLSFVKRGKKIAYSPSMGPVPTYQISKAIQNKIVDYLKSYASISVREEDTANRVYSLIGQKPVVTLDPTFLLPESEWKEMAGGKAIIDGDYVFMYSPWDDMVLFDSAIKIAESLKLPIVTSMHYWYSKYHRHPLVKYVVDVGPEEFLNLVRFSKLVVSGSFHAVVFSIIFKKPFYAVGGEKDSRIYPITQLLGIEDITREFPTPQIIKIFSDRYLKGRSGLYHAIDKSRAFLNKTINH